MHEKDHLDRMLESSLLSYGDAELEPGLAERILARVSSEQRPKEQARGWRNRFVLWAALPAAACLLLSLVLWKPAGPKVIQHSGSLPESASTNTGSKAPEVEIVTRPAPKIKTRMPLQHSRAVAESAVPPKLDVFPRPKPLSAEEQALYAFATQVPEEQRQAVLAAQKSDDAPLNIAAISIQPLEIPDSGKN